MIFARTPAEFCSGPVGLHFDVEPLTLIEDDRIVVAYQDCEMLLTVLRKARGVLYLGCFLAPWSYAHFRLERRDGIWRLSTGDGDMIRWLQRRCS